MQRNGHAECITIDHLPFVRLSVTRRVNMKSRQIDLEFICLSFVPIALVEELHLLTYACKSRSTLTIHGTHTAILGTFSQREC